MDKDNIIMKLDSVSQALNSITVTGIQNMMNLAGVIPFCKKLRVTYGHLKKMNNI